MKKTQIFNHIKQKKCYEPQDLYRSAQLWWSIIWQRILIGDNKYFLLLNNPIVCRKPCVQWFTMIADGYRIFYQLKIFNEM
jgi:hypothetical protein